MPLAALRFMRENASVLPSGERAGKASHEPGGGDVSRPLLVPVEREKEHALRSAWPVLVDDQEGAAVRRPGDRRRDAGSTLGET